MKFYFIMWLKDSENQDNIISLHRFQNIFPLAKLSFAKGKMLGAGRHPTGPGWGE